MNSNEYQFFLAFFNEFNFWLIISILTVFQGFILSLALLFKSNGKKTANLLLSLFVFMVALSMIGRLSYYFDVSEDAFLPGALVDIIIYCYGPLSFFYLKTLFVDRYAIKWHDFRHYTPLAIYLIYLIYRLSMPHHFEHSIFNEQLSHVYFFLELMAIIQNAIYAIIGYVLVNDYQQTLKKINPFLPKLRYFKIFIVFLSGIIILWFYGFLSKHIDSLHFTTLFTYNFVWLMISSITFLFAYFGYFNADLLSVPETQAKYTQGYLTSDYYFILKDELEKVMEKEELYLNPNLTLGDLAHSMGKSKRDLSRVINEHYQQNFYDYINTFRIQKFKEMVLKAENRTFTILSLAYESGFNSKATFNAAFKKTTQLTPSEYIKQMER